MAKPKWLGVLQIALVVITGLFLLSSQPGQGQVKPRGKVRPPAPCNTNGTCELSEYNSSQTWAAQPCIDCRPKTYLPLAVEGAYPQIVGCGYYFPGIVFQHRFTGTGYDDTWASADLGIGLQTATVGDVDNDGSQEIIGITNEAVAISKRSKAYDHHLVLFQSGSDGTQLEAKLYLGRSKATVWGRCVVADADNETANGNELAFINGQHFEVWRVTKTSGAFGLAPVFSSYDYGNMIYGLDVGDADNGQDNEIVLAVFAAGTTLNAPKVWKWTDSTFAEAVIDDRVECSGMDVAKVRDIDGNMLNEIIAGGNNSTLMVWRYEAGSYRLFCQSENLGGYTQGVDVGDIDGRMDKEIIVGAANSLNVLSFLDGAFVSLASIGLDSPVNGLSVKDLDGDGADEIVVDIGDLYFSIYDFSQGGLVRTYSSVYGADAVLR